MWGIESYRIPNNDAYILKTKALGWVKRNEKGFIDIEKKLKGYVPAPNQYLKQWDWNKKVPNGGRFLKGKRITFS